MKRLKQMICGIILSLLICTSVYAVETFAIGISEVKIAENVMEMQVLNNLEDASKAVTYEVNLDGKALPLISVNSVKTEGYGTSYIFLVDISGSMKDSVMKEVKSILSNLVNEMQPNDNACLMLVGDTAYSGDFSTDKETLLSEIDAIEKLHEDTNLYFGINQALDILDTSSSVLDKKCLVILSDGEDDQITGITKEEVEENIEEKKITVCTVATIGDKPGEKKQENAKVLGSFARMSPGGMHTLFMGEDVTAEAVAKEIVANNTGSVVIKADVTGFNAQTSEVYLEVVATVDGIGKAKSGYNLQSANIKKGLIEEELETVEVVEEEPVVETAIEEQTETVEKDNSRIWIIIGIILVVIVVVILTVSNKKKKQKETLEKENNVKEEEKETNEEIKEGITLQPLAMTNENDEKDIIIEQEVIKPSLDITLVKIGLSEVEEKKVSIIDTFIIGRKEEKCDLAFAEDTMISGKHCQFINDDGRLAIEDLGSLNGTLVNGALIKQRFYLANGDIVTFGNNEWRVLIDNK